MRGYVVATVKHDNTLGIHLYGYLPTDKPVRHRVMHTIDGNGGILPGTGMALLKAAHVTVVKRPQSRNIGLYALLLLLRGHVGSFPVEPVTDLVKMTLRLLQQTETDIIVESPPADMFHRTLHLAFLPSRTRITEMRGETIVEFHVVRSITSVRKIRGNSPGRI